MGSLRGATAVVVAILTAAALLSNNSHAMPPNWLSKLNMQQIALQQVDERCDWWGTRWQFGWRGYGFYACWEQAKPLPSFIEPQKVPPEAQSPVAEELPSCVKKWRDTDGKWHARRIC
jgi:hypothetical protein